MAFFEKKNSDKEQLVEKKEVSSLEELRQVQPIVEEIEKQMR